MKFKVTTKSVTLWVFCQHQKPIPSRFKAEYKATANSQLREDRLRCYKCSSRPHAHQIPPASFLLLTVQWHSKTNGFCFSLLVSQWVSQWYRVKLKNHNNSISENFKQFILCSLLRRNSAYYVWALRNTRKVRNGPRTAFLSINSRLHAKKNWKKHLKI